jgi:hypothetical protein
MLPVKMNLGIIMISPKQFTQIPISSRSNLTITETFGSDYRHRGASRDRI